jgi:hypothetical protein
VATVAIKGSSSSSSKFLFPNLNKGKHACLMAKESKRNVKHKSSPPKYISSDDKLDSSDGEDEDEEALLEAMSKNPKARIKRLLSEVGIHDEILDQQEKLLVQEKESNQELKMLLKLKKEKMRSLTENLRKVRRLSLVSRAQIVLFKIHMISYKRLIKILKCNLMLFGLSISKPSNNNEVSTSQVSVEICDELIAQGNDQLKLEVKRLEKMVSELVKQVKVRHAQDNRKNMVNKLEKSLNVTRQASQQSNKAQHLKKQQKTIEDEKIEYARSEYLNAKCPTSRMTLATR